MHTDPTSPHGERRAAEKFLVRAATPQDAAAIIQLRSAYILSTPLSTQWIRRCADELAVRLMPGGDARAFVIDSPTGGWEQQWPPGSSTWTGCGTGSR
ncbi:hypothetical protein ABT072_47100, partial [Streptomyces sp. NPDC002589]